MYSSSLLEEHPPQSQKIKTWCISTLKYLIHFTWWGREPKHSGRALSLTSLIWAKSQIKGWFPRSDPLWGCTNLERLSLIAAVPNCQGSNLIKLQPAAETAITCTFSKWFWLAQSSKLAWGRRQFRFAMVGWSGWEVWVGGSQGGRANIATTSSSSAPQSREEPLGLKVLSASHLNSHLKRTMCWSLAVEHYILFNPGSSLFSATEAKPL